MTKELVNEKVAKQNGSRNAIPTPPNCPSCGRGSGCVSEASYKCRSGVNVSIDSQNPSPQPSPTRGEGACHNNSGTSQSLINDKDLARASRGRALSAKMTKSLQTTSADPFNASEQDFAYSLIPLFTRKCKAFTLAEVLITLGVIGIVAAMTIPNLVQSYKEKVTVTKLKKTYAVLANAFKMAEYENGSLSDQFGDNAQTNAQKIYEYIAPYIKTSKVCGFNSGCLTSGYIKDLNGNEYCDYDNIQTEFKFVMADGVDVWVYMKMGSTDDELGNIKVDIDGKAGEYTFGKDVFIFTISRNHGIYPAGRANDVIVGNEFDKYCNLSSEKRSNGAACTAWVIINENMDYLHCDDLSWNGKHKCSD